MERRFFPVADRWCLGSVTVALFLASAAPIWAETGSAPAYTQSVMPHAGGVLGVTIGPGGPDVEFGLDETNGGVYSLSSDGHTPIDLSDGLGLRNPTGLARIADTLFIVDGSQIIAFREDGEVLWRVSDTREGVFFYDVEPLDEDRILVGDFGNGRLISVDIQSGEISDFAKGAEVPGLARFEIAEDGIFAVAWGSDDAWDGGLWMIKNGSGTWRAKEIATGFGNAEAVAVVDGDVLVGGYRGHEASPEAKLMKVAPDTGAVAPLEAGSGSSGISDITVSDGAVWLSYLKDGQWEKLDTDALR